MGRYHSPQPARGEWYRPLNVMFTHELARRLEATGVTATVLHPGVTRTAFAAEEVTGNVALTCRYYGITRQALYQWRHSSLGYQAPADNAAARTHR